MTQNEPSGQQVEYFASCPKGLETLLAQELKRLKAQRVRPLRGGVSFFGTYGTGYRVCVWSRLAARVLCVLDRVDASDADALYKGVRAIRWERHVGQDATVAVSARGSNAQLRNTKFVERRVKDALCDRLRALRGKRPEVRLHRPDVAVSVAIRNDKATISLDFSGESLYRRDYARTLRGELRGKGGTGMVSALDPSLAAGLLVWGGWDKMASPRVQHGEPAGEGARPAPVFIDPCCDEGSVLVEAAMMLTDRAPGLTRDHWGFEGCADFDAAAFDDVLDEADDAFERGLERLMAGAPNRKAACLLHGYGFDQDRLDQVRQALHQLGLDGLACLSTRPVNDVAKLAKGLSRDASLFVGFAMLDHAGPGNVNQGHAGPDTAWCQELSCVLGALPQTCQMAVCADEGFDLAIGYRASESLELPHGPSVASLRKYSLEESLFEAIQVMDLEGAELSVQVTSDHAAQFGARLRKMLKARRKWARKEDVHAYRVYDADLPDYAVAVDVYEEADTNLPFVSVTEYQAPKEIDPVKAAQRFHDACVVTQALLGIPDERFFTRVRRQDKGGSQYHRARHDSHRIWVREAGLSFEVDLSGYLDTGLFLDHRITREHVGKLASGKRFLNLFAYTGTASVHAAAAGAKETTTVDMSQTYLEWAQRNMRHAGFTGSEHRFVRADVLSWLEKAITRLRRYDVVFVDPPTFSNSKSMGSRTWDIQRDHVKLLSQVRRLLAPGGVVVFSGNLRTFKLDGQGVARAGFAVRDITAQTIPEDFSRNPRIHFCFELTTQDAPHVG